MISLGIVVSVMAATTQINLTPDSLPRWSDYIRPKAQELAFEETGWIPTFIGAVTEATKTNKPILLWAMNGHPLACT